MSSPLAAGLVQQSSIAFSILTRHRFLLSGSVLCMLVACGSPTESAGPEEMRPSGNGGKSDSGAPGSGGVPATGGTGSGGTGADTAVSGGTSSSGGANGSSGGSSGVGASGAGGSSGSGGSGGTSSSGGASGSGGTASDPDVDADGCPLTLEGFATLEGVTTGGEGGPVVTVVGQAELEQYATQSDDPYVIRVQGTIKLTPAGKEIPVKSNKTIIGVGTSARIDEGGFGFANGVNNVIIRNLTIGGTGKFAIDDPERKNNDWDGVQMDTAHHIWIDHCKFEDVYDGMIDVRLDSNFITLSWNHFQDHYKTVGIGWTENLITQITLHHNWFDNCEKRNPNCGNAYCHSYNNILEDVDEQGSLAEGNASLRIENGVFRNSTRPWYAVSSTAKVEVTGSISENISKPKANGTAFNPRDHYDYELDEASVLDDLVKRCVGPRAALGQ